MDNLTEFQDTSTAVGLAKKSLHIDKPNIEMFYDEIRSVCRWVAQHAPDTVWLEGKPHFGRQGIDSMLFIALTEFPDFYEMNGLSQFN